MKDWNGNAKSVFTCNGASNHSESEREKNDYYATEPRAVELLLEVEEFCPYIWECAVGGGHIAEVLKAHKYKVRTSDIIDRGYPSTEIIDFLKVTKSDIDGDFSRDIITNPPYKYAKEFVEKALELSMDSTKIAMLLKLTFLESKARRELFRKYPPKTIYVFSERVDCAKNGDFTKSNKAIAYAWYIWEKGYKGNPTIKWIN